MSTNSKGWFAVSTSLALVREQFTFHVVFVSTSKCAVYG